MHYEIVGQVVLEEIGNPLTVILKNHRGKISARTEAKVDNENDYKAETDFIDRFMVEIFSPIGHFNEILKVADHGSLG